jgi:hypothetical protein
MFVTTDFIDCTVEVMVFMVKPSCSLLYDTNFTLPTATSSILGMNPNPEDGGRRSPRNVVKHLRMYTT